jgi:hypothetical protein
MITDVASIETGTAGNEANDAAEQKYTATNNIERWNMRTTPLPLTGS